MIRARNGLPIEQVLGVGWRIAGVLRAVSGAGIHHLDLTSQNIFVDPETLSIRIGRYGFSRLLPSYSPARRNEPFHGTAEYLAPEVCSGKPGDASADLYALGILMYEMVAGKPPFVSSSPSTTLKRQVYEKPLPLRVAKPGIPGIDMVERLILRLLSKDPKMRPADAAEAMAEMEALKGVFPGADFQQEALRDAPVEVVCLLQAEPKVPVEPPAATPESRETRVFTGLAEQVAQQPAQALQARGASAVVAERPAEASRPTEAFDPSLVEAALKQEAAAQEVAAAAPAEADSDAATAVIPAAAPGSEQPAEGPPEAAGVPAEQEAARKASEWFVDGSQALPESVFPPEEEESKESRMFWVIVAAVAVLLIVGTVVYFEGSRPPPPEPPPPVVLAPPVPAPAAAPPVPVVTPPMPDPGPAVAAAPDAGPASAAAQDPGPTPQPAPPAREETPEQIQARQLEQFLEAGRSAFEAGHLEEARKNLEEALKLDRRNATARALLADIRKAERAAAPRPAPAPRRTTPRPAPGGGPDTLQLKKPAQAPAPPAAPDEAAQEQIKRHIREGRNAYNSGDYAAAIRSYNQALALDPNNALVKKLLDQAKAKANE